MAELIRTFPEVLAYLMQSVLGLLLPAGYVRVRLDSEDLSVLPDKALSAETDEQGSESKKRTGDNVVLLEDAKGDALLGVNVEIQLKPEAIKRFRFPQMYFQLRERLYVRCKCE